MLDTGAAHSIATPLAACRLGVSLRRVEQDPYRPTPRLARDLLFRVDPRASDTSSKVG